MTVKALVHRAVWQRLPQRYRRQALFAVTALLAPRPAAAVAGSGGPVVVAGCLRTASGLGESARLCLDTLRAGGIDARGVDLGALFMHGSDLPDYAFPDGRDAAGPGTLILHVNAPLVPLALGALGRRLVRGKRIIGYWAWELPDIPPDWRTGFRFVHEIWVPSRFTAQAVARHTGLPVRVVPHPVSVPKPPPPAPALAAGMRPAGAEPGALPGALVVLTMFNMASGLTRKNPAAAVAAFKAAFGDDPSCRLLVKVANAASHPAGMAELAQAIGAAGNITVLDRTMTAAETYGLIAGSDTVLSLHRSEGFGLVLAEAMAYGRPVVATAWSGNMDFMTPDNACLVDYRLVPAGDPQGTYDHADQCWADPDPADAARHLRRLRNPAERRRLGERAARDVAALCDPRRYRERLGLCAPLLMRGAAPRPAGA